MSHHVLSQEVTESKCLWAEFTLIGFLPRMDSLVAPQVAWLLKGESAVLAGVRLFCLAIRSSQVGSGH